MRELSARCAAISGTRLEIVSQSVGRPADLAWYVTDNGITEPTFNWRPKRGVDVVLSDIHRWMKENDTLARRIFGA